MNPDTPAPDIDLQYLRDTLPGRVVLPGDRIYDLLRMPFNTRPDPHPSAIIRCFSEDDVRSAVDAAVAAELPVTVRGGGHGAEGWCSITDQVVIDLSGVPFMDSAGLGALIGGIRRTRDAGGDVAVACDRPTLTRLLHNTGFDSIVPVEDSIEQALAALEDS